MSRPFRRSPSQCGWSLPLNGYPLARDSTGASPSSGDPTTSDPDGGTAEGSSTSGGSTAADSTVGDSTVGDSTAGDSSTAADSSSGGVNAAPEATDDILYTAQDQALIVDAASGVLLNDVDADGDALMVTASDAATAQGGTVVVMGDGAVSYVPATGFWGPDSFGYTIGDGVAEASAVVQVYVAPALIPLSSVAAGLGGFALDGEHSDDYSGGSVSDAGDVNGDGLADLIVGAFLADANGLANSGRSYVVFGKADGASVLLSDIALGDGGFALYGEGTYDNSGESVSGAGDVNGDGLADLIVGASGADPDGSNSGRSYVVFGKADGASVLLSDIALGNGGFALSGAGLPTGVGESVSGAGDVNGDGLADLIVGAGFADPNGSNSGRSYVVFGKADGASVLLSDIALGDGGFAIDGAAASDISGRSVSGGSDVNGDGLADLIVGANGADPNGLANSGRSYVVFGKADGLVVSLSALGNGGFPIDGAVAEDRSGVSVSDAGDVNGDGLADLIVGAAVADPNGLANSGQSYVVFGKAGVAAVSLSDIALGDGGFAIDGASAGDGSGGSVSGAGDVNGDGLADLILGAFLADPNGLIYAGRSYVVFGKEDGFSVSLSDIALGQGGFALDGAVASDASGVSGVSVSGAGDVNGDGVADLIVGASAADPNGVMDAGRSYVVFGVPTGPG